MADMTTEQIVELAFECAGAATAPLMRDHPDYTFPSERVAARVADVLRGYGIDPNEVAGYSIGESDPCDILGVVVAGWSEQPLEADDAS